MQNLLKSWAPDSSPQSTDVSKRLPIDVIDPYPDNPRQAPHPGYESLKTSIEAKGLQEPLIVSRCPNAAAGRYMLIAGGKTRLRILFELTEKHGPGSYDTVTCHYRDWPGDAAVLAGHLIENDERAGLTWLDQARSIDILRQRLERAASTALTLEKQVTALKELGVITHTNVLSLQRFTLDVLSDALPKALLSGWGRPRVTEARATYKAACALYRAGAAAQETEAELWVRQQFQAADTDNLALDSLREHVLQQLAIALGVPLAAVNKQCQVFIRGDTINPKDLRPVMGEAPERAYPPSAKPKRQAGRPSLSDEQKRQQKLQRSAAAYAKAIGAQVTHTDAGYQLDKPADSPQTWLLAASAGTPVAAPTVDEWLDSLKELSDKQWGEALKLLSCYRERRA